MSRRISILAVFALLLVATLASAMPAPSIRLSPAIPHQYERIGLALENVATPPNSADYKVDWRYNFLNLQGTQWTTIYTGSITESRYGRLPTYHLGPIQVKGKLTNRAGSILYGEAITTTMVLPQNATPGCTDALEPDNPLDSVFYQQTFVFTSTLCAGDTDYRISKYISNFPKRLV